MKAITPIRHTPGLSRRNFLTAAGLATARFFLAPRRVFADYVSPVIIIREAAATAEITITKLRGNVSVLEGSGGNIAVLTGRDGKLLVEAGITGTRKRITEALASLSQEPVKHLINTHWHFDHTDGNEWLHAAGAEITAHENTRKHLLVDTRVEGWKFTFPASPAGALPTKLFKTDHKLEINGTTLALKYYPPAHTDSDISRRVYRRGHFACGRHLVERSLSVYRLLDRGQHQRFDRRGGSQCGPGLRQDYYYPGAWAGGKQNPS